MACGCSGNATVGMPSIAGIESVGMRVTNRLVYRILAPGTVDPDECVARDADAACINFPSLNLAAQYKIDEQLNGIAMAVVIVGAA